MSVVPLVNACVIGVCLVSILLWKVSIFFIFAGLLIYVSFGGLHFICSNTHLHPSAFMMFIGTEIIAFGTLFFCILSTEPSIDVYPLSDCVSLPFLGTIVLLGSSITITTYHHYWGLSNCGKWLKASIFLGFCFLGLQLFEFWEADCFWGDTFYHSCCFSVVGLHFSHVLLGILGMIYLNSLLEDNVSMLTNYYSTMVVWYWHFVDYVWLYVYIIVYF